MLVGGVTTPAVKSSEFHLNSSFFVINTFPPVWCPMNLEWALLFFRFCEKAPSSSAAVLSLAYPCTSTIKLFSQTKQKRHLISCEPSGNAELCDEANWLNLYKNGWEASLACVFWMSGLLSETPNHTLCPPPLFMWAEWWAQVCLLGHRGKEISHI